MKLGKERQLCMDGWEWIHWEGENPKDLTMFSSVFQYFLLSILNAFLFLGIVGDSIHSFYFVGLVGSSLVK